MEYIVVALRYFHLYVILVQYCDWMWMWVILPSEATVHVAGRRTAANWCTYSYIYLFSDFLKEYIDSYDCAEPRKHLKIYNYHSASYLLPVTIDTVKIISTNVIQKKNSYQKEHECWFYQNNCYFFYNENSNYCRYYYGHNYCRYYWRKLCLRFE